MCRRFLSGKQFSHAPQFPLRRRLVLVADYYRPAVLRAFPISHAIFSVPAAWSGIRCSIWPGTVLPGFDAHPIVCSFHITLVRVSTCGRGPNRMIYQKVTGFQSLHVSWVIGERHERFCIYGLAKRLKANRLQQKQHSYWLETDCQQRLSDFLVNNDSTNRNRAQSHSTDFRLLNFYTRLTFRIVLDNFAAAGIVLFCMILFLLT